ncbi:MAG: dipeptidase [Anaerolineae bacterium]|nr:dipeptidase [Anaerolineae bacterium]
MLNQALAHARNQREQHLDQLIEFLGIPSISTLSEHKRDIERAARWLATDMTNAGLEDVEVMPTAGNPIVYGEWLGAGPEAQTVLVYGHYDVQPVDPVDLWVSPPFEPQVRDGEIYARGASDDKGQMFAHIKAVEAMLAAGGKLPVNVKMIFEGEEEVGSPSLEPFVIEHKDLLAANSGLVSDGRIVDTNTPSLVYALRGMSYIEISVKGPKRDLHSGSYGGSVHNTAQLVAEIIVSLHDENGTINIPGFYDKVRELSPEEREALRKVPYSLAQWQEETGLKTPWGEKEYTLLERTTARPTCEVNGMWGGFQGEGGKTIIPAEAGAKISMRLVPDQDPQEITQLFGAHVQQFIPADYTLEVLEHVHGWPVITPIDSPEIRAAARAYEATWGKPPVFTREGGSIPIVATFQKELGAPVVLMGFGLDDNVHAPNEHFRLEHFYRGIGTIIHYYHYLSSQV